MSWKMPEPSCATPVGQTIVFCGLPAGEAGHFGSTHFPHHAKTTPRLQEFRVSSARRNFNAYSSPARRPLPPLPGSRTRRRGPGMEARALPRERAKPPRWIWFVLFLQNRVPSEWPKFRPESESTPPKTLFGPTARLVDERAVINKNRRDGADGRRV